MSCDPELTADILHDCDVAPITGLFGGAGVLINYADKDEAGSTEADDVISDLVLESGKVGFAIEWSGKMANATSELVVGTTDTEGGFKQSFLCRMQVPTSVAAKRAKELEEGRFIAVVETEFKGTAKADAFKVLGWKVGLKASAITWSANENSASILFTLATEDGNVEKYIYNTFLEVDYATSKATFDTKFVTV